MISSIGRGMGESFGIGMIYVSHSTLVATPFYLHPLYGCCKARWLLTIEIQNRRDFLVSIGISWNFREDLKMMDGKVCHWELLRDSVSKRLGKCYLDSC